MTGLSAVTLLFNPYSKHIMRNAGLDELQARIKTGERSINNLRYADYTASIAESKDNLKSLLMRMIEESERVSWRINILKKKKKIKNMASIPITAWQIEGEKVGVVTNFLFLGSKITVDSDCSHEIRRWSLLGRTAMTNLDSMLKSRDITLPTRS